MEEPLITYAQKKRCFFSGKASLRLNIDMDQNYTAVDLDDDDKYEIGNDDLIDRRARDDDDELSLFGSLLPEWWKLLRNWQDLQVRSKQCDSIGDSDQDDDDDDDGDGGGDEDDGQDDGCGGGFSASQVKTVHWSIRIIRVVALPECVSILLMSLDFVSAWVMVLVGPVYIQSFELI